MLFQPCSAIDANTVKSIEFLLLDLHQRQIRLESLMQMLTSKMDTQQLSSPVASSIEKEPAVLANTPMLTSAPHSMVVSLKPFPYLCVNDAVVDPDIHVPVNSYYKMLVTKLADVKNMRGSLFTPKRPYAQSIVARAIIFINRPRCFVNERWPSQRPLFQSCAELNMFICKHRQFIHDFFMYAITSKIPIHEQPTIRSDEELARPHQKKFLLVHWQALFRF